MHRIASIALITLVLVACGGADDDDDDASSSNDAPTVTLASAAPTSGGSSPAGTTTPASMPSASTPTGPTTSEPTPTESTASEPTATTASGSDTESIDGAPTHASSDFPDLRAPLDVGSSGEVGSMDPYSFAATSSRDENSKVKVTITEIMDPAEIDGTIFAPEPGNRWFAIYITVEATGSAIANTGVWTLATTDGTAYTDSIVLGNTPYITYGAIEPGATNEGVLVFEIPEDAVVQWILMSPTIFVGGNLVFVN